MTYRGIQLDPFQIAAIEAVERRESVIVAAPTGAGKTVIAEYAIETHLERGRRILYTAPIKALSNQKFRDFSAAWGDRVGIVTGDVSINPLAPAVIMTTEIFRNTIFDDPARLDDLEYVILDEIHYINDLQRGTVWEESLIFAPPHIRFICLSATIPNLDEFAGWIREIRPDVAVTVIREDERPVPLEHHLWVPGAGEIHLGDLRRLAEAAAHKHRRLRPHEVRHALGAGRRDPAGRGDVVAHLQQLGRLPCLYFCFSRQACEDNARRYADGRLLDDEERAGIVAQYDSLCEQFGLAGDPSAAAVGALVAHGVAYHHAGMLPMLKEVVERLFTSGMLKLLFTTETFAVGINMPACTVVFEALEKYDGVDTRYLLCREYQQMAGRAGRRGIDPIGYVYARVEPGLVDVEEIERIVTGEVEPTESQFNLSYSSVLSLYLEHGEEIYSVCGRSFANYQNVSRIHGLEAEIARLADAVLPEVDCIKGRPELIAGYRRTMAELDRERGRAEGARRHLLRRAGKHRKREIERALARLEEPNQRLQQRLTGSPCHDCPRKKACSRIQYQRDAHAERLEALRREIAYLRHHQRDQIAKRLMILREFGYLDERGLTPKGEMAASLYGFELPVTELFYAGFFEGVDEEAIGCLMVAIVFESKRSVDYAAVQDRELAGYLREADTVVRQILRREWDLKIESGLRPLDVSLTMPVLVWIEGGGLDAVAEHTDAAPGDVVRTFRHAVDLLRQFRRCLADYPLLRDRLDRCIRLIRRDEVDAERQLRLGRQLDLAARAAESDRPDGAGKEDPIRGRTD